MNAREKVEEKKSSEASTKKVKNGSIPQHKICILADSGDKNLNDSNRKQHELIKYLGDWKIAHTYNGTIVISATNLNLFWYNFNKKISKTKKYYLSWQVFIQY